MIAALQLRLNESLLVLKGKEGIISVLHPGIYAAYFVFCCSCYTTSCMLLFFPCILRALREEMQWGMGARTFPSGSPVRGVGASVQATGRVHLCSGSSSRGDARSCLQLWWWPPAEELQLRGWKMCFAWWRWAMSQGAAVCRGHAPHWRGSTE